MEEFNLAKNAQNLPSQKSLYNGIKQDGYCKLHQHIDSEDCNALCKKEFLVDLLPAENIGRRHRTGWEKKCDRGTGADDRKSYRWVNLYPLIHHSTNNGDNNRCHSHGKHITVYHLCNNGDE